MVNSNPAREPVKVVLPDELPALTPDAAWALLKILMKASGKQDRDASEAPGNAAGT
jgi:hypothetical protein